MSSSQQYDIVVIGGGVNGAGIARDAAGRGYKVLLCEKDDLAAHTSSSSSKLIHGGLRYLENYDFKLVRESLIERDVLLKSAPHIIWPMRFIIPHNKNLRPKWLIRIGLFLYDNLYFGKSLPSSKMVTFANHPAGKCLKSDIKYGFEYSDAWVQDARLVILNAMQAQQKGAEICTRTQCTQIEKHDNFWQVKLKDKINNNEYSVSTTVVVNAAGPWVEKTQQLLQDKHEKSHKVRLVRGSHIVIPRLKDHTQPYFLQNDDGRIAFVIPYENDFTLIGTTDVAVDQPTQATVSDEEVSYLCQLCSKYLKQPITPEMVVWKYAGIRPLYDDDSIKASKVTRDYKLQENESGPLMLSVFGGKITTFRHLAQSAVDIIDKRTNRTIKHWTADAVLPGGDIPNGNIDDLIFKLRRDYSWMDKNMIVDYVTKYGSNIYKVLNGKKSIESLGQHFGGTLYECEVNYLQQYEWAMTSDDILWRRTKHGLHMTAEQIQALKTYLGEH